MDRLQHYPERRRVIDESDAHEVIRDDLERIDHLDQRRDAEKDRRQRNVRILLLRIGPDHRQHHRDIETASYIYGFIHGCTCLCLCYNIHGAYLPFDQGNN